jgi:hypothetical protein
MKKRKDAGAKYFGKPVTGDPDDAPELLNDFFRHGELRRGGKLIRRIATAARIGKPVQTVGRLKRTKS